MPQTALARRQAWRSRAGFCDDHQDHTDVFEVLIGQIRKDGEINPVFGEALRVLGHTEFFEPLRYLLHRGSVPTMIGGLSPPGR